MDHKFPYFVSIFLNNRYSQMPYRKQDTFRTSDTSMDENLLETVELFTRIFNCVKHSSSITIA